MAQIDIKQFKEAFYKFNAFLMGKGTPLKKIAPLSEDVLRLYPDISDPSFGDKPSRIVIQLDTARMSLLETGQNSNENLSPHEYEVIYARYKEYLFGINKLKKYLALVGIKLILRDGIDGDMDRVESKVYIAIVPRTEESLQKLKNALALAQRELLEPRHKRKRTSLKPIVSFFSSARSLADAKPRAIRGLGRRKIFNPGKAP